MEAIVLAGGMGSRLRSVVSDVPKPMAPIRGKPFLDYLFNYLKKNRVHKVILSVGYKWECIESYLGDFHNGIQVIYSVESKPLGTGGAIKKAMSTVDGDNVYILNGDSFFDVELRLLQDKMDFENKLILSLKSMHDFDRYGCVETEQDGVVTSFSEKNYTKHGDINGGVYLAKRCIFNDYYLEDKFSFEDFMQKNLQKLKISSVTFDEYFIDIGIPEDYKQAQNDLGNYIN